MIELTPQEIQEKIKIEIGEINKEYSVEIKAEDVAPRKKLEISLNYLKQMLVIMVQVRGFMERAEAGATTAEEAVEECRRLLAENSAIQRDITNWYNQILIVCNEAKEASRLAAISEKNAKASEDSALVFANDSNKQAKLSKEYATEARVILNSKQDIMTEVTNEEILSFFNS